jgi:hypothetical protein
MSGTTNSISYQLEQALQLQENAMLFANAFKEAVLSNKTSIQVELLNADGTTFTIDIPTNISMNHRLESLISTVENVVGISKDGKSRIVSTDGRDVAELVIKSTKVLQQSKLQLSDINISNQINIENNPLFDSLLSPITTLELSVVNEVDANSYIVEKISFSENQDISNGIEYKDLLRYLKANKINYSTTKSIIQVKPVKKRYSGSFEVLSSSVVGSYIHVNVNQKTYNDADSLVDNSKVLDIDDILHTEDNAVKYKIQSIQGNTLVLQNLSGIGSISESDILFFDDTITSNTVIIPVPVKLNERTIIFLEAINSITNVSSLKSQGIKFDAAEYTVNVDSNAVPFNDYFAAKVSDLSSYFSSILSENTIPVTLAEIPAKPILAEQNFKILQINKHLTNSTVSAKLEQLQKEKITTENQLDVVKNTISNLTTKINSGNYANKTKREADKSDLARNIQLRDEKTTLLSSIVQNISSTISNVQKDAFKPKYRLRGFWQMGQDISSEMTRDQKIIQYEIRYRYTALQSNVSTSEQFIIVDDANEKINATFSTWNYVLTKSLQRTIDQNGLAEWSINDINSVDDVNTNQLDLPISYGEAIEFQVRAISEAGWPATSVKSAWSDVIRKEFSDDSVTSNKIVDIVEKNEADTLKVQIQNEFSSQGFSKHISSAYTEQEKYFPHKLEEIASGKVTGEQKTISALEYVQSLESKILELTEIVNRRYASVSVQLLDADTLQTYDVNNFSTIKLFAGNYIDEVDLTVDSNFGSIVTKRFFLKLTNKNIQTIEMLSIAPGGLTLDVLSASYDKVPIKINTSGAFVKQKKGQIFYNRLNNVDLTSSLYDTLPQSSNSISIGDVDTTAIVSERNVVHRTSAGSIETVKLVDNATMSDYVAMTTSHPAYQEYKTSGSANVLNDEFSRISYFTDLFRSPNVQPIFDETNIHEFHPNDQFLVGQKSVGATMYVAMNDFSSFQVAGVDSSSSKEIYSGEADSILLPIVFQYRMTDALGNINGTSSINANANFEYSKKLGFDLLINNKIFSFDVEIYAKYRATSTANQKLSVIPSSDNTTAKII